MSYILINGKNSDEIRGLLICKEPPITKPKKRVKVEEIDGRDGDEITELGYASYDKELEIGLRGQFNIDEVISYFNAEGKIVFSNEPDKYYNFKIYEQIDFEKLLRFRTATVKLHCQPFKYLRDEKIKEEIATEQQNIIVRNNGNIYSKPIITIYGTGTINLSLNGNQIFVIDLGENQEYINIDTEKLEAYKGLNLKNRLVEGDYDKFSLNVGKNTISWSGNVTKIQLLNYNRWI